MELSDRVNPNFRNRACGLLGKEISSSLVNWKTDSRKCERAQTLERNDDER